MKPQFISCFSRFFVIALVHMAVLVVPEPALAQQASQVIEPVAGDLTPLEIVTGKDALKFQVELADTVSQRAKGLMFRRTIRPDGGMLFIFDQTGEVGMWMKNTYVSLDMLFLDEEGEIVNIARRTEPHSLDVIYSRGKVRAVLELAGGSATRLGIQPGDKVHHAALDALR